MKKKWLLPGMVLGSGAWLAARVWRWMETPYGRLHPTMAVLWRLMQLDGGLAPSDETLAELRAQMDRVLWRAPVAAVQDKVISGPAGPLPLRIYTPPGEGPFPPIVFFHGGGFALGSVASHENVARQLARQTKAVVISVDYRLAPEHPYPAAVDDAYAAVCWAAEHCASFQGDPARLMVAGDSAGGNLAAAVALKARDENGPAIKLQVLLYPALTVQTIETGSRRRYNGYILEEATMKQFRAWYLPDPARWGESYASPLQAADYGGLPPAYVMTAEFDPLKDDGAQYAARLRAAGVPVRYREYAGVMHGFLSFADLLRLVPLPMAILFAPETAVYAEVRQTMRDNFREDGYTD
jgi:acetyl esterase